MIGLCPNTLCMQGSIVRVTHALGCIYTNCVCFRGYCLYNVTTTYNHLISRVHCIPITFGVKLCL